MENMFLLRLRFGCSIFCFLAKYVPDKTFTFCGTPLFIAPEIITNDGQCTLFRSDKAASSPATNVSLLLCLLSCMVFQDTTNQLTFGRTGFSCMKWSLVKTRSTRPMTWIS